MSRSPHRPGLLRPGNGPGLLRPERRVPRRPRGERSTRGIRPWMWMSVLGGLILANTLLAVTAPGHLRVIRHVQDALWSMSGVFALVGLTLATVMGLVAGDRLFATPRQRVLFQATHRSIALVACGFLLVHIVLQVSFTRINPANLLFPVNVDASVAAGIIATDLLLVIVVTGVYRGRFADTRRAWTWRVIHLSAYLCWPLALVHGLTAGRNPPGWVIVCYLLCLFAVAAALVLRLFVTVRNVPDAEQPRAVSETLTPTTSRAADPADDELEFWSSMKTRG